MYDLKGILKIDVLSSALLSNIINKIIEQVISIGGSSRSLRMELGRKERFGFMPHSLICFIVYIYKERLPPITISIERFPRWKMPNSIEDKLKSKA